jgi:hypothetical protein
MAVELEPVSGSTSVPGPDVGVSPTCPKSAARFESKSDSAVETAKIAKSAEKKRMGGVLQLGSSAFTRERKVSKRRTAAGRVLF